MAKVIMTCGRVCVGKSTYARALNKTLHGVILSDDEIMLSLFGGDAGTAHDLYARRLQACLIRKAAEIAADGIDVILDWGFWTKQARKNARDYFASQGIACELHFVSVSDEVWKARISSRNATLAAGGESAYRVDEGLIRKCLARFEEPDESETDRRVEL